MIKKIIKIGNSTKNMKLEFNKDIELLQGFKTEMML